MWVIIAWHWREILIGFVALLKTLLISAASLLLNSFVKVAEGKEYFRHEGYGIFVTKAMLLSE